MQFFLVPIQVRFRLKFAVALVTSKPLHSFGGVFQQHVTSQVSFVLSPVLAIETVEPLGFFIRLAQSFLG
jgi:hypothetical protein